MAAGWTARRGADRPGVPFRRCPDDGMDRCLGKNTVRFLAAASARSRASPPSLLNQRWRTLQHITASPSKIGDIARAALVLAHSEHGYLARSQ